MYVPIVHGIGVSSHDDWAMRSVAETCTWWGRLTGGRWFAQPCTCETGSTYGPGHVHMRERDRNHEAVLDPVSWHDLRPQDVPWWRVVWWVVQNVGVLCMVHVLANLYQVMTGTLADGVTPGRWLVSTLRAMVWMAVFSVAVVPLAVVLASACLVPKVRSLAVDALAWTSDEASRDALLERVRHRVRTCGADDVVLVGHSQGGALVTEVGRAGVGTKRLTVITLGSGQALLATINTARGQGHWRTVVVLLGMAAYVIGMWLVTAPLLAGSIVFGTSLLAGAYWLGMATWSLALDPVLSLSSTEAALRMSFSALDTALLPGREPAWVWSAGLIGLLGALVAWVSWRLLREWVGRVVSACRPDLPGWDAVALADPVAAPLRVLAEPRRLRSIRQSASLTDHVMYFANAVEVQRPLTEAVAAAAHGSKLTSAEVKEEALRDGLARRRLVRAVAILLALSLSSTALSELDIRMRVVCTTLLCIAVFAAVSAAIRTWWRKQQILRSVAAGSPPLARRRWGLAAVAFALMWPMVAAGSRLTGPSSPAALAFGSAVLLATGAAAAVLRSASAPHLLVVGLIASASTWLTQGSAFGNVMACATLTGALLLAARPWARRRAQGDAREA